MLQTRTNAYTKKLLRICRQAVEKYLYEKFCVQFPTTSACLKELFKDAEKKLLRCRRCDAIPAELNFENRLRACETCGKKTSCTAGTFFDHMREPKAWLAAIWFMERGIVPTSSHFAKLVGISQSSALNILRKMRYVMMATIEDDFPTVSSAVLYEVVAKRSLETPARSRPLQEEIEIDKKTREEQEKMENRDQEDSRSQEQTATDSKEQPGSKEPSSQLKTVLSFFDTFAQSVYEALSEVPTSFDTICEQLSANAGQLSSSLLMLAIAGLVAQLPGEKYVRVDLEDRSHSQNEIANKSDISNDCFPPRFNASADATEIAEVTDSSPEIKPEPDSNSIPETRSVSLTEFVDFALLNFTGISRKHIQLYVSALWCRRVRYRWGFGGLRELCLRSEAVTDEDVLNYVTPPIVTLFEHEN